MPAADAHPHDALLLRAQDAAKALAISPRLLWTLSNRGEIPVVKIGRSVRYAPQDLQRWIEGRKSRTRP